jgi:chromosome segregation ATPase
MLALMTFASASVGKGKSLDSVVQKVIEMLQANKVKVAEDLAAEEKEAAEYSEFCDTEVEEKGYAIKTAARKITQLDAVVADAKAQIAAASSEIAALGTEIAGKQSDLLAATEARKKESADFKTTEATLLGSVAQLEKAIILIKRGTALIQNGGKPDPKAQARALSLLLGKVINAAWVDHGSATVLKGFLQEQGEATNADEELSLLKGKQTSKTQTSSSILETLSDMKEKAQETLSGVRMTEMKGAHNFGMMKQSITDQLTLCEEKLSDQKSLTASLTEAKGKASGENAQVAKTKMADTVYVDTLKSECAEAADTFAEKSKSAKEEMAAIEKAKSILAERVKVFFVQTGNKGPEEGAEDDDEKTAAVRSKLVSQLKNLGHKLNSYAMMELASSAAADPFEKIKGLLSDMIAKLVTEANEEASQKSFCDEEKAKSGKEKEAKSMRSDDLQSRLDSATAAKASREQDIKELQKEIAELDASVSGATKLRTEEKATYMKASADFKGAASAVEEAIHVLKEFYASTSFVQVKGKTETENDTIIAILENSGAEFTKMYMEAETAETAAVDAYEKLMDESKVTKAAKTAEISAAESEVKSLAVAIQNGGEDLKMVGKELDAIMSYIEKLKPQCEVKVMSYEEKKAKREAEIEGLKEAPSILEGPALLQQLRGTKRH